MSQKVTVITARCDLDGPDRLVVQLELTTSWAMLTASWAIVCGRAR